MTPTPGGLEASGSQASPAIKLSGCSYDVKTCLVTMIVPPRSRQSS